MPPLSTQLATLDLQLVFVISLLWTEQNFSKFVWSYHSLKFGDQKPEINRNPTLFEFEVSRLGIADSGLLDFQQH